MADHFKLLRVSASIAAAMGRIWRDRRRGRPDGVGTRASAWAIVRRLDQPVNRSLAAVRDPDNPNGRR